VEDILSLKASFLNELQSVTTVAELQQLKIKYLGKKGIVTTKLKNLSSISPDIRPAFGKAVNEVKSSIEEAVKTTEGLLKQKEQKKRLLSESIDITLPGKATPLGRDHPIHKVLTDITGIFISMGFEVEEGPEVERDYYNFEALNIPKDHSARDMQDTFYISEDVVLRTHTSPVQIRVMEKKKPPLKIIAPGKVYRCDADISHTAMFHQVEGFMVDTDISFSHLKGVLHLCSGKGCTGCRQTGWIEILGAGVINPRVFEIVGYDPEAYSGFAFGMGVERIAMLKYAIDDIRLFYENDLRFLRQF
jgi:phenylalanyl-tRNA synthetase alpha chain